MNTQSAFGVKLGANGRNNSQHCWPNNVSATTPNNTQQTDATCNIQRCWELLANYVASVWPGYATIANSVNHTRTSIKRPLAEFCSKRSRPRVTLLCQLCHGPGHPRGPGHPDPQIRGRGRGGLPKTFFAPSGLSLAKNKGGGGGPHGPAPWIRHW